MPKAKKITLKALSEAIGKHEIESTTVEWCGLDVVIKDRLTFTEMAQFAHNVTSTCFSEDSGEYLPEVKDFATKSYIVAFYTNVPLPTNLEDRYDLIYGTDIISIVMSVINLNQLKELLPAIDSKIEAMINSNTNLVRQEMDRLYIELENLHNSMQEIFNGITSEDMTNMIATMSQNKVDEEVLVREYMKQSNKEPKHPEE